MRYFILIIVFILFLISGVVYAVGAREIELTDGSVITGEIVSMSGGIYTIQSDNLGTIKVGETNIRAIRVPGAPKSAPDAAAQVQSLQKQMMSNAEIMEKIQALKDDEDFRKILQDPEIMKAVNSGDIAALMADPRFMDLLNNQTVKDIQKTVGK